MDVQDSGEARLDWLVPIGISWLAILAEFFFPSLTPLVVLFLCAAALSLRLPQRQFLLISAFLACAISLPMLTQVVDREETMQRGMGLVCLLVIVASRLYPSLLSLLRSDWESAQAVILKATPTSTPSTVIQGDKNRAPQEDSQAGFSLDGLTEDGVAVALERLRAGGTFDKSQLRLVETEMRMLEGRSVGLHYASSLQPGVRVGRFVVDQPLGRGGEGNVYSAHDEGGELAAIKILHNMRISDRFRREMHLVRQLAHPNIVTAYEVGEFRGLPFITMELLEGPDLNALVQNSGPLNCMVATHYILQATRALAHAHRRDLIHRDIKPGNIILNAETVKLVDFGLAAMFRNEATVDSVVQFETKEGHLAGTLPYMAPEQARSLANATVQSDIYGIGATWFYLLTGEVRLRGKTFSQQFENLLVRRRFNSLPKDCMPQSLRNIYRRMVSYDVSKRYVNCADLAVDIEQALETAGELVCVEGINVLVVEDSRTDMLFTIEMLRRSNPTLSIHEAKSLSEGIDACHQVSIDLVLLDLTLPDSVGVETVARFRSCTKDVPLVVLTGLSEDEIGEDCLAAGANAFISKDGLTSHRMERTIFVTLSRCGLIRKPR